MAMHSIRVLGHTRIQATTIIIHRKDVSKITKRETAMYPTHEKSDKKKSKKSPFKPRRIAVVVSLSPPPAPHSPYSPAPHLKQ